MRGRIARAWQHLNEPRESRGYVTGWGCPSDQCDGLFSTVQRADLHGYAATVTGRHDVPGQRRVLRQGRRALRQLRRQGRRAR